MNSKKSLTKIENINQGLTALKNRLIKISRLLHLEETELHDFETFHILRLLLQKVYETQSHQDSWLLLVAISGRYPKADELREFHGLLTVGSINEVFFNGLKGSLITSYTSRNFFCDIELIEEEIVVDVDFCAKHSHNTGIQRVTREIVKLWGLKKEIIKVAWSENGSGFHHLSKHQHKTLLGNKTSEQDDSDYKTLDSNVLLIPWNCKIALTEVPEIHYCDQLACLAEYSSNQLSLIGYDFIPLTSSEYVHRDDSERFISYLSVVKHAKKIAAISEFTAHEFRSFNTMISAQGLPGPEIRTLRLPNTTNFDRNNRGSLRSNHFSLINKDLPIILSVGTIEPRKNQETLLKVAEKLWNDGVFFNLVFVGKVSPLQHDSFRENADKAVTSSGNVYIFEDVSDSELFEFYEQAVCSVFISFHEGYGLPVVESLSTGCPVIVSDRGSMRELSNLYQGCVLVDPNNVEQIADAIKELVLDRELRESLSRKGLSNKKRGWPQYADELWKIFFEDKDL